MPTSSSSSSPRAVRLEAAGMTRRVLAAVDAGELDASGPKAVALVRHLEGSVAALEASTGASPRR